jgi:hypothetical protein
MELYSSIGCTHCLEIINEPIWVLAIFRCPYRQFPSTDIHQDTG